MIEEDANKLDEIDKPAMRELYKRGFKRSYVNIPPVEMHQPFVHILSINEHYTHFNPLGIGRNNLDPGRPKTRSKPRNNSYLTLTSNQQFCVFV